MFGTIRKHQTWLWWGVIVVIVVSFVIYFSPYTRTTGQRYASGEFGSINGQRISSQQFGDAERDIYLRYFFMSGGRWPDADAKKRGFDVEQQTYQWLLILQEQERFSIHVGTEAAADYAREMIAQFTRNSGAPPAQFVQQLLQPKGFGAEDLERFARHSLGLQELVSTLGLSGKLITPQEAKAVYQREFEELSTEAVLFPASNYLAGITVAPEALSTYFYSNHLSEYRVPEKVQVDYVRFPLTNHLAEANAELAKMTNVDQQIDEAYRQHGTNLLRELKAVSLADAKTKYREARRKEFEVQAARKQASDFAAPLFDMEPLRTENLEKLATAKGLAVGVTAPFDAQNGPSDLNVGADFVQKAFARTPDDPLAGPLLGEDAVYVIALKNRIPSEIPPLDKIRDKVVADYKYVQGMLKARMAGMEAHRALTNSMAHGKSFAAACVEAKVKPVVLPPFSLSTRWLPEVEVSLDQLKQLAFGTSTGKVSNFQGTSDGGLILYVKSKLPLDEAKMNADLPAFLKQERQRRQEEAFNRWFSKEAQTGLRGIPAFQQQQPSPGSRPSPPPPAKS